VKTLTTSCLCDCVDEPDGFNLSQRGEPQFQFLDVTDNTEPQTVTGAAHYYASLPQPQPMYLIIDQSGSTGTVLTTSGYVAPVPPMMPPQMQSGGMMLPAGIIPATRSLIGPPLLRPGLIQQSPVIMPNALVPQPAPAPLAATTILPAHGTMLPLAQNVAHMPVPPVSELPLNATATLVAGYAGQPLHAGANGLDNSVPVDMRINGKSARHEDVYVPDGGRNVNNSAAQHSHSDVVLPVTEHMPANFEGAIDKGMLEDENGLVSYEECSGNDTVASSSAESTTASAAAAGMDSCVIASVNGALSVDALHELSNSSETSSVTSPGSVLADMTLNDNAAHHDVTVSKDSNHSHSPIMTVSSTQASSAAAVNSASSSATVKTKAPSWASLLKDTTTATNAIVISVNDSQSVSTQQKADDKSVVKELSTQQSTVAHVSNDVKLKLHISGLYVLLQISGSCNHSSGDMC